MSELNPSSPNPASASASTLAEERGGLLARFAEAVTQWPDRTAITRNGRRITYQELDHRANQYANCLLAHRRTDELIVTVAIEDRMELIGAMLGIFRAGGVFVPLDLSWPDERLRGVLGQARPLVCIVDEYSSGRIEALASNSQLNPAFVSPGNVRSSPPLLCTDRRSDPAAYPVEAPGLDVDPNGLRYIYFTSGSTGQPKGIAGRLAALDHFVQWETRALALQPGCRVSQLVTPTFDAFFRDTLVPLCVGGVVCIPPRKTAELEIRDLLNWIESEEIQLIHCVPSLFKAFLEGNLTPDRFPSLKHILLSGEAVSVATVKRWKDIFCDRIELVNLYGATETTMVKFFHRIRDVDLRRGVIPIGRPIDGTEAIILNEQGLLCAPGQEGEIYVRTPHRSLGYYKNEEATRQVFVPNPLTRDPNDVVYKTGDLGLINELGDFLFLGRKDLQVKINGIRVELGEVKNAILSFPSARDCAVVMRTLRPNRSNLIAKDSALSASPEDQPTPRMVAYVVMGPPTGCSELRSFLTQRLPEYMIPARIIPLVALPLNSNGKLDAKALPEPNQVRPELSASYAAPQSDTERRIATVWQEALGIDLVGLHDSFFELGGDSLLALRVVNRLRSEFRRELTIRNLFECESIARLAHCLEAHDDLDVPTTPTGGQQRPDRFFPLSLAQQGLLYLWKADPHNPYYTAQGLFSMKGLLNVECFRSAWRSVQRRHEALRARFSFRDGAPVQEFGDLGEIELPVTDLGQLSQESQESGPLRVIRETAALWTKQPFDLERGPIVRFHLFRQSASEHVLLIGVHEIAHDLWSVRVLVRDLAEAYQRSLRGDSAEGPPLPVAFSDYVLWESQHITHERLQTQESFWRRQLAGRLPVLELPFDRPRPAAPSYRGSRQSLWLDAALSGRLNDLSRRHKATLFMTLLSAFKQLLRVYSGQNDIIVGAPLANRQQEAAERLVGFFLNMLPLRARLDDDPTFIELLERTRLTVSEAIANAAYPFLWMLEWADAQRDPRFAPVFQVMFNMLSFSDASLTTGDLEISYRGLETGHTKYDLSLYAQEHGDRIHLQFSYQVDLFEDATIQRMMSNFVVLLSSIVDNPATRISELKCLSPEETKAVLVDFNVTRRTFPMGESISQVFERQAAGNPEYPAYFLRDQVLTYQELNERANRLAHHLLGLGAGAQTRVAVCLDRSFDLVIALLAILKAGGTYVGLDPEHPPLRRHEILQHTGAAVVVLDQAHDDLEGFGGRKVLVDRDRDQIAARPTSNPAAIADPNRVLNIVYTSSSTGRPKGVLIPMRAAMNRLHWMWESYPFQAGDVAVLQKSCTLVAAFCEIFGALLKGYPTVILTRDEVLDTRLRWRRLVQAKVTHLLASPAFLRGVLEEAERHPGEWASLRLATTSAEPIFPEMARRWLRLFPQVPLLNLYGASECSSNATVYDTRELPSDAVRVPIGRPIANTRAYVLDQRLKPVPMGVVGELCVAGDCVAHGYLDLPDLTQERFLSDPFCDGLSQTLYRTGDLARLGTDGTIELIGRNDFQIKIRGFRVDPGEIESVVETHSSVQRCAVMLRESQVLSSTLVAYVTLKQPISPGSLRDFVRLRLPDYMVPVRYIVLEELPLTANGKIDRNSLPQPDPNSVERSHEFVAPRTALETMVARIWTALLKVEPIGLTDNFFELGGHSLLATQLISYLGDLFQKEFPLRCFLQDATVSGLAAALASAPEGTAVELSEFEVGRAVLGEPKPGVNSDIRLSGTLRPTPNPIDLTTVDAAEAIARAYEAFHSSKTDLADSAAGVVRQASERTSEGQPSAGAAKLLSGKGRQAFHAFLRTQGIRSSTNHSIPRRNHTGPAPLSYPQQRIWLLQAMEPASPLYNVAKIIRMRGRLDAHVLQETLNHLVRRHEILRTNYRLCGEAPMQIVNPFRPIELPLIDLSGLPVSERESELNRRVSEAAPKPFDLSCDPMLRARLFRLDSQEHALLLSWHHITSDGWSLAVRFKEISDTYNALVRGQAIAIEDPVIQYADFAAWQRHTFTEERLAPHATYWRERLLGAPDLLELPTDRPRPAAQTYRGATLPVRFNLGLSERLREFNQQERTTLYMTLLAGFQCLLYQYSGQEDIVVGSPIANRQHSELEDLIGIFMNMLPMRVRLSGETSVRALFKQVEASTLEDYAHQDLPFEHVVKELQPQRNPGYAPIFQVMFNLLNLPRFDLDLADLQTSVTDVDLGLARYDLSLYLADDGECLAGRVEYSSDLFDRSTVVRMMDHFQLVLLQMIADPSQRVSELPTLGLEEQQRILVDWNRTSSPYPSTALLHDLVDAQARETPEATAIVFEDQRITCVELRRRSDELAAHLRQLGVVAGERVGLFVDRSIEMVVAMLATLKAGCAYVPMDPDFPAERLRMMITDAAITKVITTRSRREQILSPGLTPVCVDEVTFDGSNTFRTEHDGAPTHEPVLNGARPSPGAATLARTIALDPLKAFPTNSAAAPEDGRAPHEPGPLTPSLSPSAEERVSARTGEVVVQEFNGRIVSGTSHPEDLAYVLFTSGSTGRPKGVAISHRALVNFLWSMRTKPGLTPQDAVLAHTTYTFDISALEIFLPLIAGARLVLLNRDRAKDGRAIAEALVRHDITLLQATPAMWRLLLSAGWPGKHNLKMLIGGEACPPELARELIGRGAALWNMYGPTETTVWSAVDQIQSASDVISIGRPIANTEIYIVTRDLKPVPVGVPGEILIGGGGLADGYLDHPDLTCERFIPHPFSSDPSRRVYRTGDLGKFLPDGRIVVLGRIDFQVKVRGFRIELGEIENALDQHPLIRQSVAVAQTGPNDDKFLIAYIVPEKQDAVIAEDLKRFLAQTLPDYMIPAAFVALESFPLTSNGKVDRKALPKFERTREEARAELVQPRNQTEKAIAEIFAAVLGVDQVGVGDDFFDLGGHSLKAMMIISRIRQALGIEIPFVQFFDGPTVAELARLVENEMIRICFLTVDATLAA